MGDDQINLNKHAVIVAVPKWRYDRLLRIEDLTVDLAFRYHSWRNLEDERIRALLEDAPDEELNKLRGYVDDARTAFEDLIAEIQGTLNASLGTKIGMPEV